MSQSMNRPHWADAVIAILTGLILITYITSNYFSCRQLKLTGKALDASIAASRTDQRAWLGVKDITLSHPLVINLPIDISVNTFNSGRTPALDADLVEISVGDSETHMTKTAPSTGRGVVAPNNNEVFLSSAASPNNVIEALISGRIRVYVRGRLEYKDIFGSPHQTLFCAYYPTGGPSSLNFFNCSSGNYMD